MADLNENVGLIENIKVLTEKVTKLIETLGGAGAPLAKEFLREIEALSNKLAGANDLQEQMNIVLDDSIGKYGLLALRLNNINTSVYGATEAFTSIIPVIDSSKLAFDRLLKLSGQLVSLVPGIGNFLSSKVLNTFGIALNFATETIKFQIEAAQKVTNAFLDMSKVGATFGGSMEEFAAMSSLINVPMQLLAKVTKDNMENLSKLGLTAEQASSTIFQSSMKIFKGGSSLNDQVLAMYGSFEDLSAGVADYYALLSQTGVRITKNLIEEREKSGAVQNYLIAQKELTTMTGKSSKALKEAEEKRRNELDYSLKASRLANKDAQDNLQKGIELITQIFNQEAGDAAKEFFATGGNIYSEAGRRLAAMAPDALRSIQSIIGNIDTDRATFEARVSTFFKENKDMILANARAGEDVYSINRAANNESLKILGNVNSAVLKSASLLENLPTIFEKLREIRQVGEEREGRPKIDDATQAFLNSTRLTLERQLEIDQAVFKNIAGLDRLTSNFFVLQTEMINFQSEMFRTIRDAIPDLAKFQGEVTQIFAKGLAGALGVLVSESAPAKPGTPTQSGIPAPTTPTPASTPTPPPTPEPTGSAATKPASPRATGGIATGPTLVGEAGIEAVIPLEKGPIPLNIDWRPLVSIMNQQVSNLEDIKDLLEDTQTIQKDILAATY